MVFFYPLESLSTSSSVGSAHFITIGIGGHLPLQWSRSVKSYPSLFWERHSLLRSESYEERLEDHSGSQDRRDIGHRRINLDLHMVFQFLKDGTQHDLSGREGSRHPPREGDRSFNDSFGRDFLTHEHDLNIRNNLHSKLPFWSFSVFGTESSIYPEIHHSLLLHFLDVLFDLQNHSQ